MNGRPLTNKRGELQIALPRRTARKDRKMTTPPAVDNRQVQKALNAIEMDYQARKRWWERVLIRHPDKLAEKRSHIRRRLESLQEVRIHIARMERELGIQTHPVTPR